LRVDDTALEAAPSHTAYCGVVVTLYPTADAAEAIMRDGFRDGEGSYGFVDFDLRGVFVSVLPADVNDGAKGDQVPEVVLPMMWIWTSGASSRRGTRRGSGASRPRS
jgi:hypothetical protein